MAYPSIDADLVGWVTEEGMIEVDRVMIDDLGISLLQMMENAGRNLARVALDLFTPHRVWVAAGSGGNGGGGMVAARHLHNAGVDVCLSLTRDPAELTGVPATQFAALDRMGIPLVDGPTGDDDLTVDAVVGYSLRGAPRGRAATLIQHVDTASRVLSLDVPSGIDATTGSAPGAHVAATATMTLALPKTGLRTTSSVGRLLLADISVPPSVTAALGGAPDFRPSPILEITAETPR